MENEFEKGFIAGYLLNQHKSDESITDDKWEYPSNWLKLPEPAENQVILLADNKGNRQNIYPSVKLSYIGRFSIVCTQSVHIDWGDGSSSDIGVKDGAVSHSYTAGSGHVADNSEQWIITVTFDANATDGTDYISSFCYSEVYDMYFVAIKSSHVGYVLNPNQGSISLSKTYVEYFKVCKGDNFKLTAKYLKKLEFPRTVTKLPDRGLSGCISLIDVDLSNITEIGEYAFNGCSQLNPSGKMPKLTKAGKGAFYNSGITGINFPCLSETGTYTFYQCYKLEDIVIPETLKTISELDFYNCYNLKTINLSNVESIKQSAFSSCYNIKKVESDKVTAIGDNVFNGCRSLTSAKLPSCNSLGFAAFGSCYALSNCILQSGAEIGNAFRDCSSSLKITYV